jgi:gliding motility-associated protein GldE
MYLLSDIIINTPDIKTLLLLVAVLALLTISALLSGSEVAFFSLSHVEMDELRRCSQKHAKTALNLLSMPEKLLSTIVTGNIFINIVTAVLSFYILNRIFVLGSSKITGVIIQTAVIIPVILLFGEIIPRTCAVRNRTGLTLLMAYPLFILVKFLKPFTPVISFSSHLLRRKTENRKSAEIIDGLSDTLELKSDNPEKDESILKKLVNFGNINVNAIMCPRIDVTAIEISSTFDRILALITETGFSRIPVYKGSFDNVKGILYARDVLPYTNSPANFKWQTLLRPPYFVPETKRINDLLKEFQIRKMHMAIVIDEYGGTSGIVTLDDILEEIVGELGEEEQEIYRKLDEKTFLFEGKVLLNDFCRIIGVEGDTFEDVRGESETLAGLILELTREIPQKDRKIKYRNFTFVIEAADKRRIREIRVTLD